MFGASSPGSVSSVSSRPPMMSSSPKSMSEPAAMVAFSAGRPGPGSSGMPVTEPRAPSGVGNASSLLPSARRAAPPSLSPPQAASRVAKAAAIRTWRMADPWSLVEVEGHDAVADRGLPDAATGHASPDIIVQPVHRFLTRVLGEPLVEDAARRVVHDAAERGHVDADDRRVGQVQAARFGIEPQRALQAEVSGRRRAVHAQAADADVEVQLQATAALRDRDARMH